MTITYTVAARCPKENKEVALEMRYSSDVEAGNEAKSLAEDLNQTGYMGTTEWEAWVITHRG
jgi:hypothetical protein